MSPHDRIRSAPIPAWMLAYLAQLTGPRTMLQIIADTGQPPHVAWRAVDSAIRAKKLCFRLEEWDAYYPVYHLPSVVLPKHGAWKKDFRRPLHLGGVRMNNGVLASKGKQPPGAMYPV